MWNIRKSHPTYQSGGLGKTDSRNKGFAKSVGKNFRFPSFKPVFKNAKNRYVFGTIRKNAPNNWTKIGYTFGRLKYRRNKRSAKLKIKSQIVRVTIFCVKKCWLEVVIVRYLFYIIQWSEIEYLYREDRTISLFIIIYYMQSIFY